MINNTQLQNNGISNDLRETRKGNIYPNRVDTTGQRRTLNVFNNAVGALGNAASRQQKVYGDNEAARATNASSELTDPQLHAAIINDNNSDPYRNALRGVALHRSYINVASQIQQQSQNLLGQNLTAPDFQKQLTSYATGLMNNNPDIKNFDPQMVAGQFYNPLLKEIGNQTVAYSAHVGQQMKEQALQGIGETAEAESDRILNNPAMSHQERIAGVTNALQQAEQQLKAGGYDSRVRGGKIMQTAIALAEKTGNLNILRGLNNVQFNGKPISEYPEYLTMIDSTTNAINARANTVQQQHKADHLKAEQDATDAMFIRGAQGGSVTDDAGGTSATRSILYSNAYTPQQKKAYISGMNTGLRLNNNATTNMGSDFVNKAILDSAQGKVSYTANEWASICEQRGISTSQYQQGLAGMGIGKKVSVQQGLANNPIANNLLSNIKALHVKPTTGFAFNSNDNVLAARAYSSFAQTVMAKISAAKGGELSPQDTKELESMSEKITSNYYKQKAANAYGGSTDVTTTPTPTTPTTTHAANSESVSQGISIIGGLNGGKGVATLNSLFKSNPHIEPQEIAEQLIKRYPNYANSKQQLIDAITNEQNRYRTTGE